MEPSGKDVLEIGCGTGQATLPLAERGCNVAGVEMGENLARMARSKVERYPNVRIVTARFEDWDPRGASFDMVFAVTSVALAGSAFALLEGCPSASARRSTRIYQRRPRFSSRIRSVLHSDSRLL